MIPESHPPTDLAGSYWRLLRHYVRAQRRQVALLTGLIVVTIALQLLNPQLVRRFLDAVEAGRSLNDLFTTAGLFMGVAVLAKGCKLASTYVGELVAWTATNELRADLARHCLGLDMTFHKAHKPGELIERVDGDVNQLATFFSQLIIQMVSNLLLIAGVLVLLVLLDWRIGLSIALLGTTGLALLNAVSRYTVPRWQRLREISAALFGYVEEWLSSTEELQTNAAAPYVMRRLYAQLRQRWLAMQAAMRLNYVLMALPNAIPALAYVAAYLWGNTLFRGGVLSIGTVYVVFYYVDLIKDPLWTIQRQFEDLQRAAASLNRILLLFQERPTIFDGPLNRLPSGALAVQFERVTFAYEDDAPAHESADPAQPVLQDLTFTLRPGRVLGLLGRTGSGKSTLIRLLYRFYDPTAGAIRIGKDRDLCDLRQLQQAALRGRIGLVTQEVQLFHASVRDNLTLFDDGVADERILAALAELGLREWLNRLPDGLSTRLEGNDNLSAGEAQLLALARVFLADPGLVILDEASSRLDPATEGLLEQALDRLLAGRTVVIIAHRLATVQRADEIMILENGRILEHASRQQLLAAPDSRFNQLLQTGLEEALA